MTSRQVLWQHRPMEQQERINNAIQWAEAMRKVRGSVESTYIDGEIKVVATEEATTVTVAGAEVEVVAPL